MDKSNSDNGLLSLKLQIKNLCVMCFPDMTQLAVNMIKHFFPP